MKLYDTLSKQKIELQHNNKDKFIKIYLCGVTVYDDSHIGHARTIIVFDVLHRYLLFNGYKVKFIQNFTDVDDKIIKKSKILQITAKQVSSKYIDRYFEDFNKLNILKTIYYTKATEHIDDIINLIKNLIDNDYAYLTMNGVYFDVKKFKEYGKLSKKTLESLEAGARIEIDPMKRNAMDFALWKFTSDKPRWESPWGKGRPGWHIECSAMALKHFDQETIDIHGGGNDLIFPHHENEIAQSEAKTGHDFANIWMHCGMVNINSEKMSKSLGNIITVKNAIEEYGKNTIRLFCISTQYSKPLDYSKKNLDEALIKWRQIENCYFELLFPIKNVLDNNSNNNKNLQNNEDNNQEEQTFKDLDMLFKKETEKIFDSLDDDLNTPIALSIFMKLINELNELASKEKITEKISGYVLPKIKDLMNIFGFQIINPSKEEINKIEEMIVKRNKYRTNKEFDNADKIRNELLQEFNVELIDHKKRTIWKKIDKTIPNKR
ncbi:MAG: cysteine--tRNA ligase [Nitrososphaeraceae archaeon]